jgi:integrase
MGRDGSGVREASATSYEITFTYKGRKCRERLKIKPSPANRKRVDRHLGAIIQAIEDGNFDYAVTFPDSPRRLWFIEQPAEGIDCTDYFDEWLEEKKKHLKASTLAGYAKIVNNLLIPWFKGKTLAQITRPAIKEKIKEVDASNKRLANIQSVLRSALADAVHDEKLDNNPLTDWTYQRKEVPKAVDDVDPFTKEEQEAILAKLDGQAKNLVQFALWTGLRPSEYIALNWSDIDWRRGVVRVTKAFTQAATEFEEPKTRSGKREVKLLPPAVAALAAQKTFTQLNGQEIFQNPRTGERWEGDQPLRKTLWMPALQRAKVRYRRPYQMRHTYASMMLSAGESPMWVANQMGHADWGMIRQIYGRFIPDSIPEAGNKAVAMFGGENAGQNAAFLTPNSPKKQA